jgi:hypothetical protein
MSTSSPYDVHAADLGCLMQYSRDVQGGAGFVVTFC